MYSRPESDGRAKSSSAQQPSHEPWRSNESPRGGRPEGRFKWIRQGVNTAMDSYLSWNLAFGVSPVMNGQQTIQGPGQFWCKSLNTKGIGSNEGGIEYGMLY